MGGFFFPTQEDYDSYEGYNYSDPLGINKLKKEEPQDFLGSLMDWANKYEYEGTHDIDPITGEVTKKSLPGILGGVVGDLFSIPKRGVDWVTSKASGLDKTVPAEEILTNALFPKYDSAPIADNLTEKLLGLVPGGALVTAHDNLSKLKKSGLQPISDAAEVGESALRGATRTAGSLLLDPTLWTGLNAPGKLGTAIGGYFGFEGAKGASEKLGESYAQAFDQGKPTEAIEPFIEALGLGYLGKTGLEHSGRELARTLPEVRLGDYSTRSKLNFESKPAESQLPNFVSAIADGKAPKAESSFLGGVLDDPLLKRYDELKELGVLVNPTGRIPKTETLYHGTGNEWGVDPTTGKFNPFSSRKASSSNLHGGPFYLTDSPSVAEGAYSVAGEGLGPKPEINTADVTTTKSWDLDAPVPRDIRVKGLTLIQRLLKNAENPQQARYYGDAFARLKEAQTGRDVESIMSDIIDREYSPEFDRFDPSGLHYTIDPSNGKPVYSAKEYPLRQRPDLSGRDKFLRVLESDLGYDSVTHGSNFTGGRVTIPFSRKQIKTRDVQKLTPLSERSSESLIAEYKTLDPSKESNAALRDAIKEALIHRFITDHPTGIPTPEERAANKDAYDIIHNFGTPEEITNYQKVEPELTPEDEALIKTPLYESLKNPEVKISESTTPETTDIKDWISEEPKDVPVGEWVDKAARALGYQDVPNLSRIQGESLSESAKFIQSQKRKYGKDWESKQTQSEGDYLRKLLAKELSGEVVEETPPTVIQNRDFEPVDSDVAELRDSISAKSPYEMVGKEAPRKYSSESKLARYITSIAGSEGRGALQKDLPALQDIYSNTDRSSLPEMVTVYRSGKVDPSKRFESYSLNRDAVVAKYGDRDLQEYKIPREKVLTSFESNTWPEKYRSDPFSEHELIALTDKGLADIKSAGKSSLDRAIEQVVAKRPPKTPKAEEPVDIEGEPLKKQNFQVSLSNGEVYTVKATDEIGAREQVQDLIDKHKSKFNITDVKPKYSKLESDLITSANPTEERLATKAGKEVSQEEIKARTTEEKLREKAQLAELRDQLKVERQKAQAGDKEAKLRERAIEQEIKDKLRVEEQFRKEDAKRQQKEFQEKLSKKEPSGVSQFLGSVKALASSGDLGHIARQGKQGTLYLLTHSPKEVGAAFKRMAKQTFSEKEFKAFHEKLAQDPKLVRMSKDFNLDMPGLPGHLGEEAFHGGEAIESIKGLGSYVRGSDRAYTSYMNSIRYSLVNDGIRRLEKSGFTMDKNPEKYRQLARGINIITQRGDISGKAAQLFNTASNVFWAPRAKYSRIQQIGELVKPGESGRLARQGLAHTMAFNALLFGLLKAKYGDDIKFNTDPTNTDFLKIRIKNTTVDPWFGLGAIIRSANQGLKGEKTSGSTGRTVPVSGSDTVGTFLTNSLAPGITMLYELASGKSTLGFEKSRLEALLGIAPLAMRDIRDITEEHGLDGLLLDILSYEGEQVNTFNPKKAKAEQERLKKERGLKVKPKSSKGTGVNYKELYNF